MRPPFPIPARIPAPGLILALAPILAPILAAAATPAAARDRAETVAPAFRHALPNVPGKSLVAVTVDYPPGAASAPHRHARSAFVVAYVVSGAVASRVDDGPERVYRAGESFHEDPGSRHPVSRNASATEPARLLAVFVVDTDDTALVTPDTP